MVAVTTRTSTRRGSAAADAEHLAVLEHAQELRLEVGADLADLVEEERAAVGALEAARARGDGARERAALVAEELALEHALGERLAVDRDERPADAVAPVVQQARDQLLAGAALALDEHGRAARRHAPHEIEQLAALRALGDDALGRVRVPTSCRSQRFSRSRRFSSSARATTARSSSLSNGLVT